MCGDVFYNHKGQYIRGYFPNPKATLPVLTKTHEIKLLPWGRRKEQAGQLPMGGWARLDSIYAGRWDKWFPTPVKLPIKQFMEKDIQGNSHWFDLTNGQFIQGLIARDKYEQRVYIVTITPELDDAIHNRWPRILSGV